MSGYLTWTRLIAAADVDTYDLRAPNREIKNALGKDVLAWAKPTLPIKL